jgi:hypothetical protein
MKRYLYQAVTYKDYVLWDKTPYNLMEVYRRFGGQYCFPFQARNASHSRTAYSGCYQFRAGCLLSLLFDTEDGGTEFLQNIHCACCLLIIDLAYSSTLKMEPALPPKRPLCFTILFLMAACLAYSSTLKMAAVCSSATSGDLCQTTRHHIPEVRTTNSVGQRIVRSCSELHSEIVKVWI